MRGEGVAIRAYKLSQWGPRSLEIAILARAVFIPENRRNDKMLLKSMSKVMALIAKIVFF